MNRFFSPTRALPVTLALTAALVVSAQLPAQDAKPAAAPPAPMSAPGKPDTSLASGGHYTSDPHHTLVEWSVDHMGFTPYYGLFGDITGTLDIDPKHPEQARVAVIIPVSAVTVASAGLKEHLFRAAPAGGKPDFFGPSPQDAHFVSTAVHVTGDEKAEMTGNLTLNGVTKPVTLQVHFYGAGSMPPMMGGSEVIGFEATGAINRSEFGMGFAIPLVSDRVDLKIAAAFMKADKKPAGEQ